MEIVDLRGLYCLNRGDNYTITVHHGNRGERRILDEEALSTHETAPFAPFFEKKS